MADETNREIKRIDPKEFRALGFLQEVNRCFLHPLGLALEVMVAEDGTESLGGVWDYRDDLEGMTYSGGTIDQAKIDRVNAERAKHAAARARMFGGSIIQQPGQER